MDLLLVTFAETVALGLKLKLLVSLLQRLIEVFSKDDVHNNCTLIYIYI